ncbi:hypothetical protein FRC04_002709 [Tulasnella sp. 424]|nr:hypothetical protein FRC04_002709 [Tulasnella sp. 424]KAG8974215.1 hypothetical protein FRC05_007791 [Tulasnella sp. 425]
MKAPPPDTLTREGPEKLQYPQMQQLCKERGIDESAGRDVLIDALLQTAGETDPRPVSDQNINLSNPTPTIPNLSSLHDKVTSLTRVVEFNEAASSLRFDDIESRVTKLETQQHITDVSAKLSQGGQGTLADLAKRLEVMETFVYSMPMDLSKTIGKPKYVPPPSGFELERRIAALERAINVNTVQEGSPIGFEGPTLQPIPGAIFRASNDAGMSRSFSSFEQVFHPGADALNRASISKYLALPAPPGGTYPFQHHPAPSTPGAIDPFQRSPSSASSGGTNPFQQPPSPAPPLSESGKSSDFATRSMGPEEVVGPEFAWPPEHSSERPQASPAPSDASAGNGSYFDVLKDQLN